MYKLSKTVSLILSVTVLAVSMLGVQAAEEKKRNNPFADTYDKWYETSVDYTYGKGLVSGFDDGTFKPDATISRAEFSVILERLFNRETVTAVGSEWYSQAEAWIKANDIMAEIIQNDEFEPSNRGIMGVIIHNINDKTGLLAGVACVSDDDDVMIITNEGVIIRTDSIEIPTYKRSTTGVRVMKLNDGQSVANMTLVKKDDEDAEENAEAVSEAVAEANADENSGVVSEVAEEVSAEANTEATENNGENA